MHAECAVCLVVVFWMIDKTLESIHGNMETNSGACVRVRSFGLWALWFFLKIVPAFMEHACFQKMMCCFGYLWKACRQVASSPTGGRSSPDSAEQNLPTPNASRTFVETEHKSKPMVHDSLYNRSREVKELQNALAVHGPLVLCTTWSAYLGANATI